MLSQYAVSILVGLSLVIFCIEILRRDYIQEKFAITWLLVSSLSLIFAVFPSMVERLANTLSIKTPSNFIFFFAIVFLAVINMQIILELGRLRVQIKLLAKKLAESTIQGPENESK
ncbi:Protein of unknown function DUF2304 [Candidatus Nanopelagicaceae bacterium]